MGHILDRLSFHLHQIFRYLTFQIPTQIINFLAGLLIVRNLGIKEYALYTIANSFASSLNVLSDSGISSGLAAIGGRVWKDPEQFGQLIKTAIQIRGRFVNLLQIVLLPIFFYLLNFQEAGYQSNLIILFLIFLDFQLVFLNSIYMVIPRLFSQPVFIQKLEFLTSFLRTGILLSFHWIYFSLSFILILNPVCSFVKRFYLKAYASQRISHVAPENLAFKEEIYCVVGKQFPYVLYFCISPQVAFFVVSYFGNPQGVAEIGALGRLGVIFAILGSMLNDVIFPVFSRAVSAKALLRSFFICLVVYIAFSSVFLLLVNTFPQAFLSLLGGRYAPLEKELFITTLSAILNSFNSFVSGITYSRGWIFPARIAITSGVLIQILLYSTMDSSRVENILLIGAILTLLSIVFSTALFLKKTWDLHVSER